MKEEWRKLVYLPPNVEVSDQGNIRIFTSENDYIVPKISTYAGLKCFTFMKKTTQIHRAVADAFVENPEPDRFKVVKHKNGDKTDNRAENLEWSSNAANLKGAKTYTDGIYCKELDRTFATLLTASCATGVHPNNISISLKTGDTICGLTFSKIHNVANAEYIDCNESYEIAKKSKTVAKYIENIKKAVEKKKT